MKIAFFLCAISLFVKAEQVRAQQKMMMGPHVLVYKTKKDFHKMVPVLLSGDKRKIISYPDPLDIKRMGTTVEPVLLHRRYYLDNSGISANTVFLKLSYKDYAQLEHAPSTDELYQMIADKNPLTELYDCGARVVYHNIAQEMNRLIDEKELAKKCIKVYPVHQPKHRR